MNPVDKAFSIYSELHIEFRFEWQERIPFPFRTIWMMKNVKPSQVAIAFFNYNPRHLNILNYDCRRLE